MIQNSLLGAAIFVVGLGFTIAEDEPFRPEAGKFPPLEKAHSYRGELVFVDHSNRRGSVRVEGDGMFFRNDPHPFAMLPYGMVQYQGSPADLRDIPLGTVMHVHAYLPPDPRTSVVPVLPVDNKEKDANHYRGTGIFPAENHVFLLEDEPSYCLRNGLTWKLGELSFGQDENTITAQRVSTDGKETDTEAVTLSFDHATRVWRGRELLTVEDLIEEGSLPRTEKTDLKGQNALLGICWKPTSKDVFTRFHISDVWLDDEAIERAAHRQAETHKAFIRSRWMSARIDKVDYDEFGQATATATLFGGMDEELYADFKEETSTMVNAVTDTLKHTHGAYGPAHMASKGKILEVTRSSEDPPFGSSGIQVRFETDLIIEGIRPGRVVRIRPGNWPLVQVPREEYIRDSLEERFPTPDIFPKY